MEDFSQTSEVQAVKTSKRLVFGIVSVLFLSASLFYFFGISAPSFSQQKIVSFEQGESLDAVSRDLASDGVIRSAFMLRTIILLQGGDRRVVFGLYSFDTPQNAFTVARRLIQGDFGLETVKLTVPEGTTRMDIADLCARKLELCSKQEFLRETADLEGYLFPDTYFFLPYASTSDVVQMLNKTYEEKIQPLRAKIKAFGKTEKEVVTMASILEGEARQMKTRQIVAGILWRRLSIGMPLQVDAAFVYVNGKSSADLTLFDLKIDSPFNTYVHKGLTPTPINNPGLESIEAAITPIKSQYLYFLTGRDGNMYYAKTLAEHEANRIKYLK